MAKRKSQTTYEWAIETWVDGECLDHNHRDRLHDFGGEELTLAINRDAGEQLGSHLQLVLVCDKWDQVNGGWDRLWAYITNDGKLPEFFSDSLNNITGVRVPKRFHQEFAL